jgi:putative heme iron utilization protein
METDKDNSSKNARALMRANATAVLATAMVEGGWPYGSLVLVACDHDAAPLLLLSALAKHTKNLAADDRVSLLYDGTRGLDDPLTGPRLTVLGRIMRSDAPRHRARYLARHPSAAGYVDFTDFAFYRLAVERAHLVAGFGRIDWIEGDDLVYESPGAGALAEHEGNIVDHMNADHGDALDLYARVLLGESGSGWRMTGCDTEGCDLRREGAVARLPFPRPVEDAAQVRAALVELVHQARAAGY